MAPVLLPEDIPAAEAERILRFVNAAGADALADAVGFSEGREVGRMVAADILAVRQREGRITSVARLFGMAAVTPRRFAEMVTALTGIRPEPRRPGGTLSITPEVGVAWLGVPIAIDIARRDGAGRPSPGTPVTVVTSWGRLSGADAAGARQGAAVTLVTDRDGLARPVLGAPLDPPLSPDHQDALAAALGRLSPDASPAATTAGLKALAATYRAGAASALGAAVERLCAIDGITQVAADTPPADLTVTVVATAEGGAGPTSVTGLTLRDWRGPFLGALAAAVRSGDVLDELLGAYDATVAPDTGLARGLLAAAAAAEVAESGLLARGFQRDVAAAAMGRFLDARAGAAEGLEVLVRTAGAAFEPGGVRLIDSVETVQDIRGTGGALVGEIAGRLEGRIGQLEDTAVPRAAIEALSAELATKADASSLTRLGTRIDAALAAKLDAAAVDSLVTRLDVTESGLGTLTNRVQGLSGSLDGLRDTVAVIDPRRIAELELAISRLGTTIAEVDGRISVTGDRLERLDQNVATLAGATVRADDIRDLRSEIETLRNGTATLSTDIRTLGTAVTGLRGELAGKADAQAVTGLRSDIATLRTENQRLSTSVKNIDTRIGTLVIQPNRPPR